MAPKADTSEHLGNVRRYYDHNDPLFERFSPGSGTIHRAVWGPGVKNRAQAFHHLHELLLQALPASTTGPAKVVDLGCGVGASLLYLAGRAEIRGEGLTLSSVQARRAATLIESAGSRECVRCREGNYLDPPEDLREADLVFSIEAFVHGPDPAAYFHAAARLLHPGGRLVVCDDFLGPTAAPLGSRQARWLEDFRAGWRVGSLVTVEEARALAVVAGLRPVGAQDLTPYLELRRPRDRLISLLLTLGRPFSPRGEYWLSLLGGDALQRALVARVLTYNFLTFEA